MGVGGRVEQRLDIEGGRRHGPQEQVDLRAVSLVEHRLGAAGSARNLAGRRGDAPLDEDLARDREELVITDPLASPHGCILARISHQTP